MSLLSRIGGALKAAFSPAAYLASSVRVWEGWGYNGAKHRPWNYDAAVAQFVGWAYAAANLNANAVANVPLRLYARARADGTYRRKGYETRKVARQALRAMREMGGTSVQRKAIAYGYDVVEVVEPHPILTVLESVNDFHNGYETKVALAIDLQATGNAYLHPVLDPDLGVPMQAWRMPSHWTKVIPSADGFIKGYAYGRGELEKPFDKDEVIQFKMPGGADLHYGKGWFEAAWSAIGLSASKREMDAAFFDNMARPDWLLSITNGGPDAIKRLQEAVKAKHEGPKNAGKMMVTSGDVKATPLQFQVSEYGTPTRVIEEIAAISGVPVAMLLSNDPNRSNSEAARLGWHRNTVLPYLRLIVEKLNERWVPLFDNSDELFICQDFGSFEDEQAQAKVLVGYVGGGVLSINEAREVIGYGPAEGGDSVRPPSGGPAPSGGEAAVAEDMPAGQNDERHGGRGDGQVRSVDVGSIVKTFADMHRSAAAENRAVVEVLAGVVKAKDSATAGDATRELVAILKSQSEHAVAAAESDRQQMREMQTGILADLKRQASELEAKVKAGVPTVEHGPDPVAEFRRKVILAFLADGTVNDLIANLTDLGRLVESSGLPRNPDYKEPYLPVMADNGQPVTGEVRRDPDGDVVGGVAESESTPATEDDPAEGDDEDNGEEQDQKAP